MKVGVLTEKFLAIVNARNLPVTAQSGFHKVHGPKGSQLYIANTKVCYRIDISGFEAEPTIAKVPDQGKFGKVTGQLRFEGTEEEILARFTRLVDLLQAQPEQVKQPKPPKAAPVADSSSASSQGTVAAAPTPEEKRKARLLAIAKIEETAAKMGKEPSKKILAEKAELLALETAQVAHAANEAPAA